MRYTCCSDRCNFGEYLYFLCLLALFPLQASAGGTVKVEGKVYDLVVRELLGCGTEPESRAMKFALVASFGATKQTMTAKCIATCQDPECERGCLSNPEMQISINTRAIQSVFSTVRNYPPGFISGLCASPRDWCISECVRLSAFGASVCSIQCNQFDLPFKG